MYYNVLYLLYYISRMIIKGGMTVQLDTNNHSVFLLQYHLIMCVKYRRPAIDDDISSYLRDMFVRICPNYHIILEEWNHDQDHVHVLFRAQPHSTISKFINAYKSASSRMVKKAFPSVRRYLWKEMFWSKSFCLLTTGGVSADVIRAYIKSQGEKPYAKQSHPISSLSK